MSWRRLAEQSRLTFVRERGVHNVSLEQIAAEAGVSKGILPCYFKTKENLVLATMRWVLSATAERIDTAMKGAHTPEAKVLAMIDAVWARPEVNRAFHLTTSTSPPTRHATIASPSSRRPSIR